MPNNRATLGEILLAIRDKITDAGLFVESHVGITPDVDADDLPNVAAPMDCFLGVGDEQEEGDFDHGSGRHDRRCRRVLNILLRSRRDSDRVNAWDHHLTLATGHLAAEDAIIDELDCRPRGYLLRTTDRAPLLFEGMRYQRIRSPRAGRTLPGWLGSVVVFTLPYIRDLTQ